jgi:hypothetical protein
MPKFIFIFTHYQKRTYIELIFLSLSFFLTHSLTTYINSSRWVRSWNSLSVEHHRLHLKPFLFNRFNPKTLHLHRHSSSSPYRVWTLIKSKGGKLVLHFNRSSSSNWIINFNSSSKLWWILERNLDPQPPLVASFVPIFVHLVRCDPTTWNSLLSQPLSRSILLQSLIHSHLTWIIIIVKFGVRFGSKLQLF